MAITPEKRVVRVAVTSELLIQIMTVGNRSAGIIETIEGIPKDALYCGNYFDPQRMEAYLYFTHGNFDIVPEGSPIPIRQVVFKTHYLELEGA